MKLVLVACLAVLVVSAAARAANPSPSTQPPNPYSERNDAAFAKAFVCPDPRAPLPKRKAEIRNFMDWVGAHHRDWTIRQALAFRFQLLETHDCKQTLQNLRAHAQAANPENAEQVMARAKHGNADAPAAGNGYGVARFTTEQAGRNAAGELLDTRYGNVPISDVAARGFAPDTDVDPNQAENWKYGIEAYMRLDGYSNFTTTVHQSSNAEFNAFLDAMTNQEGRTDMGRRSYANLGKSHPSSTGTAGLAPLPQVVALPQTATIGSRFVYTQFRVAAATPADAMGESTRGMPAWQVTMLSGTGSWQRTIPAALPKFVLDAAPATRSQTALFLVNGEWIAVPAGWHVLSAMDAVTPTWGVTFVAPGGPGQGWLAAGGAGPGMSEVFSGAEGYFSGAYRLYDAILPDAITRDPALSPTPDSLAHPDPCTALVTYGSGDLVVQGVKLFQPLADSINPSPYVRSYFIALPKNNAALQDFLTQAFLKQHPVQACRTKTW